MSILIESKITQSMVYDEWILPNKGKGTVDALPGGFLFLKKMIYQKLTAMLLLVFLASAGVAQSGSEQKSPAVPQVGISTSKTSSKQCCCDKKRCKKKKRKAGLCRKYKAGANHLPAAKDALPDRNTRDPKIDSLSQPVEKAVIPQ